MPADMKGYIRRYGIPQSLYVDKHSTYKTTREPAEDELLRGEEAQTQFERAAVELGIKLIHAHSPQAKGRIERVFGTLQDRLVKEMRLAKVSTLGQANRFLESYLPRFNAQFEREALRPGDLHRPLSQEINLEEIFCLKAQRTIHNGYFIRWRGKRYAIEEPSRRMKRRPALVIEHFDGRMIVRFEGKDLRYREIQEQERPQIAPRKPSSALPVKKVRYVPPPDHPWRRLRIGPQSPALERI
jgi:hypothetical protein